MFMKQLIFLKLLMSLAEDGSSIEWLINLLITIFDAPHLITNWSDINV